MTVNYEPVKQGRRVTGFKFTYVCVENKKVKPKFAPKEKAPVVKTEAVDNLTHYVELRKKFGDVVPVPEAIAAEMKAKGLW